MAEMTKRERVMATVKGEPVDRVPVSFYGHNKSGVERQPETLIPTLVAQLRRFDWDLMKIQSRTLYIQEAWGLKYRWLWANEGGPEVEDYPVKSIADLKKLEKLDITRGPFGEHVRAARMAYEALGDDIPFVQTLHTPLTEIVRMGTGLYALRQTDKIRQFMREDPETLHKALSVVTQTMADYTRASIAAGASGIFMTTTALASKDCLTEREYEEFGKPYDLILFEAAAEAGATLNIFHICRENIMFDLVANYPNVHLLNWEATSRRNPSLREGLSRTDKAVWGGINHKWTLIRGPIEAVTSEVHVALEETGGRRFILGPGCAISPQVYEAHLIAAKEAIDSWQKGSR